jgi:hypothetical protein
MDPFVVFLQEKLHLVNPCQTTVTCQTALENLCPYLLFLNSTEPSMPKNKVSDLITDQEIAFARLVLSGTMTDRGAAQAVGLNPDTAAYTKSKPRVHAYMLEHRAAVEQQLVEQETDLSRRAVEGLRRLNLGREQVLARLWEIANLAPEMTRGSITGQVKAISMIVAMQGLIPDRRAGSSEKKSAPPPTRPQFYAAAWRAEQQGKTLDPQPGLAQEEDEPGLAESEPTPGSAGDAPPSPGITPSPIYDPSESAFANCFSSSQTMPSAPQAPALVSAPGTRGPLSLKKNPFAQHR